MNNEELLKIKELKREKDKIKNEMRQIRSILSSYKRTFKYQESISAIDRIQAYLYKQSDRREELDKEIENITKLLGENCNHHILIKYSLTHECPICKMTCNNEFPSTEYVISDFDYYSESDNIDEIVLNSSNEQIAYNQMLNYLNALQYSQNVKIRRIKK